MDAPPSAVPATPGPGRLLAFGLAMLILDFELNGFDLLPDLLGALLVLWAVAGAQLPGFARAPLRAGAVVMVAMSLASLAATDRLMAQMLAAWRLDRAAGPADVLPTVAASSFAVVRWVCKAGLVAGLLLVMGQAARTAGRPGHARLAMVAAAAQLLLLVPVLLLNFGVGGFAQVVLHHPAAMLVIWLGIDLAVLLAVIVCARWLPGRAPLPGPRPRRRAAVVMTLGAVALALLVRWLDHDRAAAHREALPASRAGASAHLKWLVRNRPDVSVDDIHFIDVRSDREHDQLARLWSRQVELQPKDAAVIENAARFARWTGDVDSAVERYARLQGLRPSDPSALHELGAEYLKHAQQAPEDRQPELAREALIALERSRSLPDGREPALFYETTLKAAKAAILMGDFALVRRLAGEMVAITGWTDDPQFYGHQYLGLAALHDGDMAVARAELLSAGKYGRRSPVLASFGPELPLAKELLDRGERDTVITFLDDLEVIWKYEAERVRKWRAAIRRGETPNLDRFGHDQY